MLGGTARALLFHLPGLACRWHSLPQFQSSGCKCALCSINFTFCTAVQTGGSSAVTIINFAVNKNCLPLSRAQQTFAALQQSKLQAANVELEDWNCQTLLMLGLVPQAASVSVTTSAESAKVRDGFAHCKTGLATAKPPLFFAAVKALQSIAAKCTFAGLNKNVFKPVDIHFAVDKILQSSATLELRQRAPMIPACCLPLEVTPRVLLHCSSQRGSNLCSQSLTECCYPKKQCSVRIYRKQLC